MNISSPAVLALPALLLPLAGCGTSSSEAAGSYDLVTSGFAEQMADVLIEQGKVPEVARDQAIALLGKARMDVDLAADGTFEFRQSIATDRHVYKGTWRESGGEVELTQTHEDGKEVTDVMRGTLDGDSLHMTYEEEGHTIAFELRRKAVAAPGR